MKTILNLIAVCMTVAIIGCSTTNNQAVSPGAVSDCGAKNGLACTKSKEECCNGPQCDGDAAMAAVSECAAACATKCATECASKCEAKADCAEACASMGAMSDCDSKTECCKGAEAAKTECCKSAEAALGAMSDCGAKKECCKSSCK